MADQPLSHHSPRDQAPADTEPDSGQILDVRILPQPDDETCGPTCLHAVYRYWGEDIALEQVIESARSLNITGSGRGTLAVMLGIHALTSGYQAALYTFNLNVFDPTWFDESGRSEPAHLKAKIRAQAEAKRDADPRFSVASESYEEYLRLGGIVYFQDLTSKLVGEFIRAGIPVLIGVSATYLYKCAREFGPQDDYDDIRGSPSGHFVVIRGYDHASDCVTIADPLANNPGFDSQRYTVPMTRLVPAIMLGVLTYDANLLVIQPKPGSRERP